MMTQKNKPATFQAVLDSLPEEPEDFRYKGMTPDQIAVYALMDAVKDGEPWAVKEMLSRLYGQPKHVQGDADRERKALVFVEHDGQGE